MLAPSAAAASARIRSLRSRAGVTVGVKKDIGVLALHSSDMFGDGSLSRASRGSMTLDAGFLTLVFSIFMTLRRRVLSDHLSIIMSLPTPASKVHQMIGPVTASMSDSLQSPTITHKYLLA